MSLVTADEVIEKLQSVIDPEVGLNIVDMGLVYGVVVNDRKVEIRMTLTTQGCPMGSYLNQAVESAARSIEGVSDVNVQLVWDPPWSPSRINQAALEALRSGTYNAY